jgi:hypothetical protein
MAEPATGMLPSLCDPFLAALPVAFVSVSVFDGGRRQSTVCASDPVAARLDELQLELGVGPQWDALSLARPVLTPSLQDAQNPDWIGFVAAALALGVRAYFAFPMLVGAASVGVVGLSSRRAGALDADQVASGVGVARRTTGPALARAIAGAASDGAGGARVPGMRREVHQATGMILAQLDVSAGEAFARLQAHAFATSTPIEEIARRVVARELDFRDLD